MRDYAIFDGDRFVTNALLDEEQAEGMKAKGYKLLLPDDNIEWGIPAFRGNGSVRRNDRFSRRWRRD